MYISGIEPIHVLVNLANNIWPNYVFNVAVGKESVFVTLGDPAFGGLSLCIDRAGLARLKLALAKHADLALARALVHVQL